MASDPPKPRTRAFLKRSGKAIGDRLNTIFPPSRPSPPALSQDPSSTHPGDNYSDRLVKAGSVAWNALETALRLLERSADACPPLKSAVGGLVACLDLTHVSYYLRFHILYHL